MMHSFRIVDAAGRWVILLMWMSLVATAVATLLVIMVDFAGIVVAGILV
jgi:hypothetical protein